MFGSKAKALGFTLLLEGIMMTSSAAWLTAIALAYLVLINAVANGCRLALRDVDPAATEVIDWASNLGRALAAAAGATVAAVALRRRDQVGVDWSANLGQAIVAAAGATVAVAKKAPRARRRRRTDIRKTQPRLALVAPELWS
jgi:murein DD-endopeptidase MepM/ murein hydrolase activator NlpD